MAARETTSRRREHSSLFEVYPVLRDLPPTLLTQVEESAQLVHAPAGRRLFDDGDAATHYPLLVQGRIRVSKRGPGGDEVLLYRLMPGESCAITVVTLLGEGSYPATATVESAASLYAVPGRVFMSLVLEGRAFRAFVFGGLSGRLAELMALIDELAFRGIAQRLAVRLLQHRQPVEATHQALADDLGTRREVVSRVLGAFQRSGFIKLGRKRVEVLDARSLQGFCRQGERGGRVGDRSH